MKRGTRILALAAVLVAAVALAAGPDDRPALRAHWLEAGKLILELEAPDRLWREVYCVKGGRVALCGTVEARVEQVETPRIDWPEVNMEAEP